MPESSPGPSCDRCTAPARWSVSDYEDVDKTIVRWFACGRHLHRVLSDGDWFLDCVEIFDLAYEVEGSW